MNVSLSCIEVSNSKDAVKLLKTTVMSALDARSAMVGFGPGLKMLPRMLVTSFFNVTFPSARVNVPLPTHDTHFWVKLRAVVADKVSVLLSD